MCFFQFYLIINSAASIIDYYQALFWELLLNLKFGL